MSKNLYIQPIFSKFYSSCIEQDIDVEPLIKEAYWLEKNTSSVFKSNSGGWHSDYLNLNKDVYKPLINSIIESSSAVFKELKIHHTPVLKNMWFNINRVGNYNFQHLHLSVLSGTFYLKVPNNSGNFVFTTTNPLEGMYYYRLNCEQNIFNSLKELIEPEVNKMILFPSLIPHYVEPNLSNEDRISIAFDISIE